MQPDLFSEATVTPTLPVQNLCIGVDNTALAVPASTSGVRNGSTTVRPKRAAQVTGPEMGVSAVQREPATAGASGSTFETTRTVSPPASLAEARLYLRAALNSRAAMRRAGLTCGDLTVLDAEERLRRISPVSDIGSVAVSETDRRRRLGEEQKRLAALPLNGPEYMAQLAVVSTALREVRNG